MLKRLMILSALLLLAACGGGGGGGGGSTPPPSPAPPPSTLTNFVTVTVDQGPAALNTGPNAYTASNVPYASVTICAPGSAANCQTIDHVLVDTGSVGLRIFKSVVAA